MAETPNHGYNVPDAGTQDWHEPVNENFEAFEVDIEIRDAGNPGANGYDPAEGAKYLDTDTGTVYLGDGSSWSEAFSFGGGGGGISSLTGGDGIDPTNIGDDDTLSVAWDDADVLDANGAVADWSGAADLNASGSVTANFVASLSGGDGISPGSIGDGDTVSVAWNDAADLASDGSVDQLSGALTGGQSLTDIAGTNLSIDSSGQLNAAGGSGGGISSLTGGDGIDPDSIGDGDTLSVAPADVAGTALEGDGSGNLAVSSGGIGSGELASGAVTSTEIGDGTIGTVDIGQNGASDGHVLRWNGSAWETGFPGTTGSTAFKLLVNNQFGLRLEPGDGRPVPNVVAGGLPTVPDGIGIAGATVGGGLQNKVYDEFGTVGGGEGNQAGSDDGDGGTARHATVGGGNGNTASDFIATVGGGNGNTASGSGATVGGGQLNTASGKDATVGGGNGNTASDIRATVAGGDGNTASADYATVAGGLDNTASADYATVAGGLDNTASGQFSFAVGRKATANNGGALVFGDSTSTEISSDGSDQARFQMPVYLPALDGALTGNQELTDIAGNNLSISGGQLNASTSGTTSLTGGDGISPNTITDGDTVSVAPGDIAGTYLSTDSGDLTVSAGAGLESDGSGNLQPALGNALEIDGSAQIAVSAGGIGTGELSMPFADLATLFGDPITTGGTVQSSGALTVNTDGANGGSRALELGVPGSDSNGNTAGANVLAGSAGNSINGSVVGAVVAGGGSDADTNLVTDNYGTVGGGSGNQAGSADGDATTATHATVGGGNQNTASGFFATVSGGDTNDAGDAFATISGGLENTITAPDGTIGGGRKNTVSVGGGTVGGGRDNEAGQFSTVGGGLSNTASGSYATVPGGVNNTASGDQAIVPGGSGCEASGNYSFAAGNGAVAQHSGAFVWADSSVSPFKSTGDKQFLVDANGGTGIGTNDPVTTFHVQDSVAESGSDNLGRHVAAIENTSSSSSPVPDVLGLELTNVTDPDEFNSYISFMDSNGTIGNIQGDGNGGVEFVGSLADFAECFPKADPDREFADGTVVGLDDGEVVALDAEPDPDTVLVVSTAPLVTGNRPIDEDERDAYVKLSLVGQVPVRVSASVGHGDVLVADDDGTAVARADCEVTGRPVVGMSLAEAEAGETVLVLIGGPGVDTTPTSRPLGQESADRNTDTETQTAREEPDERESRIADLEAENERLRDANEQLREQNADLEARLAAVEDHLGLGDSGTTTQGVADD